MNSVIFNPSSPLPHELYNNRFNNSASYPTMSSSGRKRKADEEDLRLEDRMSSSPSQSPHMSTSALPRAIKRPRSSLVGRPLAFPRLLETLDANQLRSVLKNICDANPSIATDVVKSAPRPTVTSALSVLRQYEASMQSSFPFGGNQSSDYAYNRVRQHLFNLLDALSDFTPHFLPPNETNTAQSLNFLDGATNLIHRLPNWDSFQNNMTKQNAYEEMAKAWSMVLKEAGKRAGGIQLQYEGWDKKIVKHSQDSGGKLQPAVDHLQAILGWTAGQGGAAQHGGSRNDEVTSVRQELLSGTYGNNMTVKVGPW